MSLHVGGGGGGGGGGGNRGVPPPQATSSCETIDFSTVLASPNPIMLATVEVGQAFPVNIRTAGKTKVAVVVAKDEVLGTITSPEAVTLVDCIEKGFRYRAQILEIRGGVCRVRVRR